MPIQDGAPQDFNALVMNEVLQNQRDLSQKIDRLVTRDEHSALVAKVENIVTRPEYNTMIQSISDRHLSLISDVTKLKNEVSLFVSRNEVEGRWKDDDVRLKALELSRVPNWIGESFRTVVVGVILAGFGYYVGHLHP